MNWIDDARWQVVGTMTQVQAVTRWVYANIDDLSIPVILFIGAALAKIMHYCLITVDIIAHPATPQRLRLS